MKNPTTCQCSFERSFYRVVEQLIAMGLFERKIFRDTRRRLGQVPKASGPFLAGSAAHWSDYW